MTLNNAAAIVLCIVVSCTHIESQDLFPPPTLSLNPSVNTSNIQLLSVVKLNCAVPDQAPYPVSVFIAQADNPVENPASWASFNDLRRADTIIFTVLMNAESEGSFVCWYKSRTQQTSGLSNSVNLVINSLPNPIMALYPPIIPVGGKYIAQCETPADGLMNITLGLYERMPPQSPGKENFTFIGSRRLAPGEFGASVNRANAVSMEYACKMEVFFKGRVLTSVSSPVTAFADELPARLYSDTQESACIGYLSLKVQNVWRQMCFPSSFTSQENVADVVCREVNCGHALKWNRNVDTTSDLKGTPRCTGKEKKIAECPIDDPKNCERYTLYVICSGAMPPPKLSVMGRVTSSWVYIRSEESVTLTCALESSSLAQNDWIYLTMTNNGREITSKNVRVQSSLDYTISSKMMEGEYACFGHLTSSSLKKTENSNSIHIYIYDPPPGGAIAAALITTILGAAIIVYVCVCRTSQEDQPAPLTINDPEMIQPGSGTTPLQEAPEHTVQNMRQV